MSDPNNTPSMRLDPATLRAVAQEMETARNSTRVLEVAYGNCCGSEFDKRQVDLARIRGAELDIWIRALREEAERHG